MALVQLFKILLVSAVAMSSFSEADNNCTALFSQTSSGGSLQYPISGNYENNVSCSWSIQINDTSMVTLVTVMTKAIVGNTPSCADKLRFSNRAGLLLADACGTSTTPWSYFINYNDFVIGFISDSTGVSTGFTLNYTFIPASYTYTYMGCYRTSDDAGNRVITTQGYYSETNNSNSACESTCSQLDYRFAATDLRNCWCGNIYGNAAPADSYCNNPCRGGGPGSCGGLASSIYYASIYQSQSTPWAACPQFTSSLNTPTGGWIRYPQYGLYPNLANCVWIINPNISELQILLTIVWRDIEYQTTCSFDKLSIQTMNGTELKYFCGTSSTPMTFNTSLSQVRIRFTSDYSGVQTGFNLTYSYCADPPTWLSWSPWGACNAICGTGTQLRSRVCSQPCSSGASACTPAESSSDQRSCNFGSCPSVQPLDAYDSVNALKLVDGDQSSCISGPASAMIRYRVNQTSFNSTRMVALLGRNLRCGPVFSIGYYMLSTFHEWMGSGGTLVYGNEYNCRLQNETSQLCRFECSCQSVSCEVLALWYIGCGIPDGIMCEVQLL